jgi:hypothetical protein
MEAKSAEDSPQTKAPPPRLIRRSKLKAGAHDVITQQAEFAGLFDGQGDILDSQGILVAHIDVAMGGADGIGTDDHPLQNGVGIALKKAAVHIGTRVAFVGVADDVLGLALGLAGGIPFPAGGESTAAPSPQFGGDDLIDHLLGLHLVQGLGQGAVTANRQVVFDAGGFDQPVHAEYQAHLLFVKGHFVFFYNLGFGHGIFVKEPVDDLTLESRLFDNVRHVLQLDLLVEDFLGIDDGHRAAFAEPVAAGIAYVNTVAEIAFDDLFLEGVHQFLGAIGQASGAGAKGDAGFFRIEALLGRFLQFCEVCG